MKMHLLNDRSTFRIQGEDTFEFLQSVLTADINPLKENKAVASCLLSAQGRVMYDFLMYPEDSDEFSCIVDCHNSEKQELIKKISMYKLRSNVNIEDCVNLSIAISFSKESNFICDPRHKDLPFRYLIDDHNKNLLDNNDSLYLNSRLKLGVSEGPDEIPRGDALPLDFWMDKTSHVSFNKGCFIGQEVTARVFHRNKIRRRLIVIDLNEIDFGESDLPKNFKYINKVSNYLLLLATTDFLKEFENKTKKPQIELLGKKNIFYFYN